MSGPRAWQGPNLARQPFLNQRPIERLALLLWLLALGAGAFATWRFRNIERDLGSKNADLVRFTEEAASARDRAAALQSALERADLPALNLRTEFLNRRIAERAFSWNRLLDRLTEVMPRGVRLRTLTPQAFAKETPHRAAPSTPTAAQTRVALRIDGQAEDTEALRVLVERLFAHPACDRPTLAREAEKKAQEHTERARSHFEETRRSAEVVRRVAESRRQELRQELARAERRETDAVAGLLFAVER